MILVLTLFFLMKNSSLGTFLNIFFCVPQKTASHRGLNGTKILHFRSKLLLESHYCMIHCCIRFLHIVLPNNCLHKVLYFVKLS